MKEKWGLTALKIQHWIELGTYSKKGKGKKPTGIKASRRNGSRKKRQAVKTADR
jgi:hypothetical protein